MNFHVLNRSGYLGEEPNHVVTNDFQDEEEIDESILAMNSQFINEEEFEEEQYLADPALVAMTSPYTSNNDAKK